MTTHLSTRMIPANDFNIGMSRAPRPHKVTFEADPAATKVSSSVGDKVGEIKCMKSTTEISSASNQLPTAAPIEGSKHVSSTINQDDINDMSPTQVYGGLPTLKSFPPRPALLDRTKTAPLGAIFGPHVDTPEISLDRLSVDGVINSNKSDASTYDNKKSGSHSPQQQPLQRPRLNRFYSLPMNPRSPSRQHFRLHNPHPHKVKETPSISVHEGAKGRSINQYQITQVLGRGSFGMVYLAVDEKGMQYALKECSKQRLAKLNRAALMRQRRQVLLSNCSQDDVNTQKLSLPIPTAGQSFEVNSLIKREIAVMKKLDHPNLVTLYEVLDNPSSESLTLVIEFCSQGSIMPVEEEYDGKATPIPHDQARLYFRDLILGVEYLHSRGVCHRDIKADNVLLSDDDVVKLADFGVSEIFETAPLDDGTSSSMKEGDDLMKRPVGSPAYMSPELVLLRGAPGDSTFHPSNAPVSGRKADIWAMGVTLYYMIHGRLPFEARNMEELNTAILYDQPDLSDCPIDLVDLFARIFDKNPRTRSSLDELRNHVWVTQGGADPLLSKEENTQVSEDDIVTEDDIRDAIDLISHRKGSVGMVLNYLDVSKSLRINHGWKGDGTHTRSVTPSHGGVTPLLTTNSTHGSVKMEKLSLALEELLNMRDWRERA